MNQPYIKLKSRSYASKKNIMKWYSAISKALPSGILTQGVIIDKYGVNHQVPYVIVDNCDSTDVIVTLTRDILPKELECTKTLWSSITNDGAFTMEANLSQAEQLQGATTQMSLTIDQIDVLRIQLAKQQHQTWMNEKVKDGWRYGLIVSLANKTHPLIRSWDDLPESYRIQKSNGIDNPFDVFVKNGYSVISDESMDLIKKLLRDII